MTTGYLTSLLPLTEDELQTIALVSLNRLIEIRRSKKADPEEVEALSEIGRKVCQAVKNIHNQQEKRCNEEQLESN